ncbi:ankyrin repeat domain-containing protein [Salmonella enterica]|nr:ankyrin repeat domain-containing protein [Salmonella enterica]EJG8857869.1 ankyrin repeat domain-containing protein [Salmonella enterica]
MKNTISQHIKSIKTKSIFSNSSKMLFSNDIETVKSYLYFNGSSNINALDENGKTALFAASFEIAELLIKAGIDVNHKDNFGNTALFFSDFNTTWLLLNKGADINALNNNNMNALYTADTSKARMLIKSGININNKSTLGHTALYYAHLLNDKNMMSVLMDAGIQISHKEQKRYAA